MTQELRDRLDDFFSHLDNDEAIAQAWQIVESLGDEEKLEALLSTINNWEVLNNSADSLAR